MQETIYAVIIAAIILALAVAVLVLAAHASALQGRIYGLLSEMCRQEKTMLEMRSRLDRAEDAYGMEPGDCAILPEYGLTTKGDNPVAFTVDYEVDIVEVSADRVKVNATGYTSHDGIAKDPAKRQSIIAFMQGQWVKKSQVEVVMDDRKKRSIKLNRIGI